MIPLYDENPTERFPWFTLILIGVNIYIFFVGVTGSGDAASLFVHYGLIPYQVTHFPAQAYPHFFSAMFLHSGIMHLAGNMLYLWIFGNNIEDVLGKTRFLLFYFLCGVIAALCHVSADWESQIPMVGASGAISGILGAYLILFPSAKVKTLIFLGFFITIIRIRAWILLVLWIGFQVFSNLAIGSDGGGVAWLAHIGGFLAGMLLILPFKNSLGSRPQLGI